MKDQFHKQNLSVLRGWPVMKEIFVTNYLSLKFLGTYVHLRGPLMDYKCQHANEEGTEEALFPENAWQVKFITACTSVLLS